MNLNFLFQESFDRFPDGIVICNTKAQILLANKKAEELFGYSPGELVSKNIEILIPDSFKSHHAVYFEKYALNPVSRNMSSRNFLKGLRKDGDEFYVSVAINSIKDDELYLIATIRDISDFIDLNIQLEKVHAQLKEALKISNLGNWENNLVGGTLFWSEEVFEIFDIDPKEWKPSYQSFIELVHPDDRQLLVESYTNSLKNNIPYNIVHRYITPGGELKYLRERGQNHYDDKGKPIKSVGTVQDVTLFQNQKILLKEYIKKVELKNQELEEYTYVAAHDLQDPVSNIRGLIEVAIDVIQNNDSKSTDVIKYLELVKKSGERLTKLISGLMETARLGKGNSFTEVDTKKTVSEVLQDLRLKITSNNANIDFSNLPVVQGNEFELRLLFQNLISNAIKYRKKDTTPIIKIDCHDSGHEWLFSVEDNGLGIEAKHKDTLFKMFRRLHGSDEIEGTGIGLAQCKKIVSLHKGEIWFESNFGEGTIFYFTLNKQQSW
ncbi:PAS domain S-box protein [Negadavirga shengliensis]|uniref:histidine kinase n=1 Tax=Negadavirga shengliensis TaxID=1389218 RepID=A0ABV9T2B5_9BACT